jgi:membrane-associated PAP2 superfamily phosphatase
VIAALPLAHADAPLAYAPAGKTFVALALACFTFGTALAAPILILLWALDRQAHRARGLAVLAAAIGGVVGNLALLLHCPITGVGHMLVGHASIGFVLVALYALLFRRRANA